MNTPSGPFDYIFKRLFSRSAKPFFERMVEENIQSYDVVPEADVHVRWTRGAADLIVQILTRTGRRLILHIEFQKAYEPELPKRMAKYFLGIEDQFGQFPVQVLLCIEDFADRFVHGAPVGDNPRRPGMWMFFRAFNLSALPAEWFVAEGQIPSVAIGLFCDRSRIGDQALLDIFRRAIKNNPDAREDVADFLISLQLSHKLKRISSQTYAKFMEATYQDYGIETVRELIYSNPEIFQRFKPDLEQKYQAGFDDGKRVGFDDGKCVGFDDGKRVGFDDGKRQTARDFYLSGVSAEQIHKVTGLWPHDYLDPPHQPH